MGFKMRPHVGTWQLFEDVGKARQRPTMTRLAVFLSLSFFSQVAGFFSAPAGLRPLFFGLEARTNPLCGKSPVNLARAAAKARARPLCVAQTGTDVEGTKTLIRRLENNLEDLTALKASVAAEVEELQASLAEKQASLTLIDDRLERVATEIQNARSEVRIASTEIVPAIVVGDGRGTSNAHVHA